MKNLPSSGQTFSEIRKADLLYVDKTRYIHELIKNGKCYFLSRPRRFGKSLLLGAMNEIFCGHRELFSGLEIEASGYDFKKYPVLLLSMTGSCNTQTQLEDTIIDGLKLATKKYKLKIEGTSPAGILKDIVSTLKEQTGEKVVILIDEYDAPILAQIDNVPQALENRKVLHAFYSALKTLSDTNYIHFMFVTGVSKFSKASIFSVFNQLDDLTLDPDYASSCGFTLPEFDAYFSEYLPGIMEYNKSKGFIEASTTLPEFRKKILDYYDGYSWDGETRILNPFSLIKFLKRKEFEDFWYESGTPTFFMDFIRENSNDFSFNTTQSISKNVLASLDVDDIQFLPLLFQTGYLTIEKRIGSDEYLLRSPNQEVEKAFNIFIVSVLTGQDDMVIRDLTEKIQEAFYTLNAQELSEAFSTILTWIPHQHHLSYESHYHAVLSSNLKSLQFKVSSEVSESDGDFDLLVTTPDGKLFIIEFKFEKVELKVMKSKAYDKNVPLAKAIKRAKNQIEKRGYAKRYAQEGLDFAKVAVGIAGRTDVRVEFF